MVLVDLSLLNEEVTDIKITKRSMMFKCNEITLVHL